MNRKTICRQLLAFLCLLAVCVGCLTTLGVKAFADEKDKENEISFYRIASAASAYYDQVHGDDKSNIHTYNGKNVSFASAGDFVGYLDEDYNSSYWYVVSRFSSSSQSVGYSTYADNDMITRYIEFGHALQAIGLDSTSNEYVDMLYMARLVGGLVFLLFYTLAVTVDLVFAAMFKILQFLNPFYWVWIASPFDKFFSVNVNTAADRSNPLYAIRVLVANWIGAMQNFGLVFITLTFLLSLGIALMAWRKTGGILSTFKRFGVRLLFIVAAVPFLGGFYTMMINDMVKKYTTASVSIEANKVLARTFVDFQAWAKKTNLALPAGTRIRVNPKNDGGAGSVDQANSTSTRQLAYDINKISDNGLIGASDNNWNVESYLNGTNNSGKSMFGRVGSSLLAGWSMLGRFMTDTRYHSSDYETEYKIKYITDNNGNVIDRNRKALIAAAKTASDTENYKDKSKINMDDQNNAHARTGIFLHDGNSALFAGRTVGKGGITFVGNAGGANVKGLSSLAMYNYLNTEFTDSSVILYSPKKVTGKLLVNSHKSVNLIGAGMLLSLMYYLNSLTLFIVIVVLGFGYAIGMLVNLVGRGVHAISTIPFGMLGNFKAMSQFTMYSIMMVVEVALTGILYQIAITLFVSLNKVAEAPLSGLARDTNVTSTMFVGITNAQLGSVGSMIMLVTTMVMNIMLGIKLMKFRSLALKSINEALASVVDRIFDTDSAKQIASKPMASQYAAGAAKGAGAALVGGKIAEKFMGGSDEDDATMQDNVATDADEPSASTDVEVVSGGSDPTNPVSPSGIEGANRQTITAADDDTYDDSSDQKQIAPTDKKRLLPSGNSSDDVPPDSTDSSSGQKNITGSSSVDKNEDTTIQSDGTNNINDTSSDRSDNKTDGNVRKVRPTDVDKTDDKSGNKSHDANISDNQSSGDSQSNEQVKTVKPDSTVAKPSVKSNGSTKAKPTSVDVKADDSSIGHDNSNATQTVKDAVNKTVKSDNGNNAPITVHVPQTDKNDNSSLKAKVIAGAIAGAVSPDKAALAGASVVGMDKMLDSIRNGTADTIINTIVNGKSSTKPVENTIVNAKPSSSKPQEKIIKATSDVILEVPENNITTDDLQSTKE